MLLLRLYLHAKNHTFTNARGILSHERGEREVGGSHLRRGGGEVVLWVWGGGPVSELEDAFSSSQYSAPTTQSFVHAGADWGHPPTPSRTHTRKHQWHYSTRTMACLLSRR